MKVLINKDEYIAIINTILDELIGNAKTQDDFFGKDGVLKGLSKQLVERMLQTEITHHLGYEKQVIKNHADLLLILAVFHSEKSLLLLKETMGTDLIKFAASSVDELCETLSTLSTGTQLAFLDILGLDHIKKLITDLDDLIQVKTKVISFPCEEKSASVILARLNDAIGTQKLIQESDDLCSLIRNFLIEHKHIDYLRFISEETDSLASFDDEASYMLSNCPIDQEDTCQSNEVPENKMEPVEDIGAEEDLHDLLAPLQNALIKQLPLIPSSLRMTFLKQTSENKFVRDHISSKQAQNLIKNMLPKKDIDAFLELALKIPQALSLFSQNNPCTPPIQTQKENNSSKQSPLKGKS